MAELLCPICGRHNSDDREFCDFCGNPLDGALTVEEPTTTGGASPPESQDEASRLDSFFSDTESDVQNEETPPPTASDTESRLDSYLTPKEPPKQTDSGDDVSRLDDYLSPENLESPSTTVPGTHPPENSDGFSRLDDYFSGEAETPQTPSGPLDQEDDVSRLDDFFADDIFDSPDPFREAGLPEPGDTPQLPDDLEPLDLSSEELSLPEELEKKLNGSDPDIEPQDPWDFFSDEPDQTSRDSTDEWNLIQEEPTLDGSTQSEEGWDFPDFESEEEGLERTDQPLPESGLEGLDFFQEAGASDAPPGSELPAPQEADQGLDFPTFSSEGEMPKEEQAPGSETSPSEWDFVQDEIASEASPREEPQTPQESDQGWDFPQFKSEGERSGEEEAPVAETSPGEWGFLDPSLAGEGESPIASAPGEDAPGDFDWLDPGDSSEQPEPSVESEFGSEGFGEDSGWLDMLQSPGSREEPSPESTEAKKPQTDWLDKIKRLNKSSDLVDEDSSFPDWLAVSEQPAAKTEEAEELEPESSSSDVPDWLNLDDEESLNEFLRKKDLTNEEYTPQITERPPEKQSPEEEDQPASGLSDSQQIKFPSWAGDQKKAPGSQPSPPQAPKDAEPFQIEEEYFDDLFTDELPDWLTTASSQEIRPAYTDELAQGELPGWVEAMRPVVESADASGLTGDDEYIENYGPLAGIPGVLPAEAEIGISLEEDAKKPLDLLATKSHQDYVNLLKTIIGDENKTKTIHRPAPPQTQRVLRWLIAIVLLVGTAGTVVFSNIIEPQPPTAAQVQGSGYAALYDEINTLYDGQPVLIAFDYQPAAAGELQTAAATVVDHLMEQGTYLSFVSTQPTGPALAEEFLTSTQAKHGYLHSQKYVNLGYLPGESSGLL
ncbi:MAG: hypothetical protein ACK2TT_05600, partial [Anaerolineales bacterium]